MLLRHALIVPAAALVMAMGTAAPSLAECDTDKLAEIVKASGVSGDDACAVAGVISAYADNACATGRQSIAMVRGMASDAYGAAGDNEQCRMESVSASKALADKVGMGCDMDAEPLMVLDACTYDDVQAALAKANM